MKDELALIEDSMESYSFYEEEKNYFDLGKWHARLIQELGAFRELKAYVEDRSSLEHHLSGREIISGGEGQEVRRQPLPESRFSGFAKAAITSGIGHAANTFSRQTAVVLHTYLEATVREFWFYVFLSKPNRMFDFLGSDSSRGQVSLQLIIQTESKESLLEHLASTCSSVAAKGGFEKIAKRIERVCKFEFPKELVRRLEDFSDLRNSIVHSPSQTAE